MFSTNADRCEIYTKYWFWTEVARIVNFKKEILPWHDAKQRTSKSGNCKFVRSCFELKKPLQNYQTMVYDNTKLTTIKQFE